MNKRASRRQLVRSVLLPGAAVVSVALSFGGCGDSGDPSDDRLDLAAEHRTFTPSPDLPLSFTASVPTGVEVEQDSLDVVFTVEEEPEALLRLSVYPSSSSYDEAQEVVITIARSYGPIRQFVEADLIASPPWAIESYRFDGRQDSAAELTGRVHLAQRNGRWFHVHLQYPRDREDLGDVLEEILSEWMWQ